MKLQTESAVNTKETQKYLGDKGLIIYISFLSAFVPLSTDIYLPALPGMAESFKEPISVINLTLILFFVFFSVGTLIWGPLSDKYGRKRILLVGMGIYSMASILCAWAGTINILIVCRVLQATGGGCATAVATAIVKDVYEGRKREAILAMVQSMVMIAPVIGPVVGATILSFMSWRGVFWVLTAVGFLAIAGALAMEETIVERYRGSILQTLGRLGVVLKNPLFTSLLLVFSLIGIPAMAFVAGSSYIYVNGYGLSKHSYSYYFALNAGCSIFGPLLYIQLSRWFKVTSIITSCFAVVLISGLLICNFENSSSLLFTIALLPATTARMVMRPPSTNILLEQQQEDTGSASALISFFGIFLGSIGMLLISLEWSNMILVLGIMHIIAGLVCGLLWLLICGKLVIKKNSDSC